MRVGGAGLGLPGLGVLELVAGRLVGVAAGGAGPEGGSDGVATTNDGAGPWVGGWRRWESV